MDLGAFYEEKKNKRETNIKHYNSMKENLVLLVTKQKCFSKGNEILTTFSVINSES